MQTPLLEDTVVMKIEKWWCSKAGLSASIEELERQEYIVIEIVPANPRSNQRYWSLRTQSIKEKGE